MPTKPIRDNGIVKRSGGRWEVYDPAEDIYHIFGSKAEAIAAQKQIEQKAKADKYRKW